MITQTMSLMASMYDAIGPGILLVAALPLFLIAAGLLIRASLERRRASD